jgi:hypothetical protein
MPKISLSDGLAIGGVVLTLVIVALDKAGKLTGTVIYVLLAVAALMTLPVALGSPWVSDAPSSKLQLFRGLAMVCLVGFIYAVLSAWIAGDDKGDDKTPPKKQDQLPASVRIKYSSRQVLQMSNVPGEYPRTLNLDNVATLLLFLGPANHEAVTLSWPRLPTVTIAEPRSDQTYKVPGGAIQTPQAGQGIEMRGLTMMAGPAKSITFQVSAPVRFIRVGERIFRVSLESVRDKSSSGNGLLEYEFAISEEDQTPENLAVAITQEVQQSAPQSPKTKAPKGPEALIAAMNSLPVGSIGLRLLESINKQPNVVQLTADTKLFVFDPISRVALFRMKTSAGRQVGLHLALEKVAKDSHYVGVSWDNSKGAMLFVDGKAAYDGLDAN